MRLLAHGDVRIKEQAFLPDALRTNPQPQNAPEERDLCQGYLCFLPNHSALHTWKSLLNHLISNFFDHDLQQYIFITTLYTYMFRFVPEQKLHLKKANLPLLYGTYTELF